MADKKISEFPITTSLADDDIFLINHLGSTNTVSYSTLKSSTNNDAIKKPLLGTAGQVLTYDGTNWVANNVPTELPTGTNGQFLTHNGANWVAGNVPSQLPVGTNGQFLTHNGANWVAGSVPAELPTGINGQFLTHNGANWVAGNVPTELPAGTNGQILTHNGTSWVGANSYIKAFGSVKYQNGDTSGSNVTNGGGSQATEMTASSFHNVVSVTWMERGIYRITLTNAMPNINYTVVSQIAPSNNFTFASNGDENFMDYSSPDYYHNGNENILLTFNKTTTTFDIVCWSDQNNTKENLNGFDFLVLSV
jgi:hypothetical protein